MRDTIPPEKLNRSLPVLVELATVIRSSRIYVAAAARRVDWSAGGTGTDDWLADS